MLLSDLGSEISGQLILLLAVAVVVMALVLLAALRRSLRLLPLRHRRSARWRSPSG